MSLLDDANHSEMNLKKKNRNLKRKVDDLTEELEKSETRSKLNSTFDKTEFGNSQQSHGGRNPYRKKLNTKRNYDVNDDDEEF